jgi:hypothetical protein
MKLETCNPTFTNLIHSNRSEVANARDFSGALRRFKESFDA